MKSTQMPLIKTIVDQMVAEIRSINKDPAKHIPVIQRVSSVGDTRYVQLITTVGVLIVRDDNKLTELDYPILDVGSTDSWGKISKGLVISSGSVEVPFQTAANASVIADEAVSFADNLLKSSCALPPVTAMLHPGNSMVLSSDGGKSLIWSYSPTNSGGYKNMVSEWTKSPTVIDDSLYGVVRGWHRAVTYAFPKDKETGQPVKLDGVALSRLGNIRNMLYVVSRELGICVAVACSHLPDGSEATITTDSGQQLCISCGSNGYYSVKENSMNIKMVDVSALSRKPEQPSVKVVVKDTPVNIGKPVEMPETAQEPAVIAPTEATVPSVRDAEPVVTESPEAPTQADSVESVSEPTTETAEEPAVSADEVLASILQTVTELGTALRGVPAELRNVRKLYKTEQKDAKAVAKLVAEIDKLKAERDALKARLDKCTAELKKWQSIGNSIKSLTIPEA